MILSFDSLWKTMVGFCVRTNQNEIRNGPLNHSLRATLSIRHKKYSLFKTLYRNSNCERKVNVNLNSNTTHNTQLENHSQFIFYIDFVYWRWHEIRCSIIMSHASDRLGFMNRALWIVQIFFIFPFCVRFSLVASRIAFISEFSYFYIPLKLRWIANGLRKTFDTFTSNLNGDSMGESSYFKHYSFNIPRKWTKLNIEYFRNVV